MLNIFPHYERAGLASFSFPSVSALLSYNNAYVCVARWPRNISYTGYKTLAPPAVLTFRRAPASCSTALRAVAPRFLARACGAARTAAPTAACPSRSPASSVRPAPQFSIAPHARAGTPAKKSAAASPRHH